MRTYAHVVMVAVACLLSAAQASAASSKITVDLKKKTVQPADPAVNVMLGQSVELEIDTDYKVVSTRISLPTFAYQGSSTDFDVTEARGPDATVLAPRMLINFHPCKDLKFRKEVNAPGVPFRKVQRERSGSNVVDKVELQCPCAVRDAARTGWDVYVNSGAVGVSIWVYNDKQGDGVGANTVTTAELRPVTSSNDAQEATNRTGRQAPSAQGGKTAGEQTPDCSDLSTPPTDAMGRARAICPPDDTYAFSIETVRRAWELTWSTGLAYLGTRDTRLRLVPQNDQQVVEMLSSGSYPYRLSAFAHYSRVKSRSWGVCFGVATDVPVKGLTTMLGVSLNAWTLPIADSGHLSIGAMYGPRKRLRPEYESRLGTEHPVGKDLTADAMLEDRSGTSWFFAVTFNFWGGEEKFKGVISATSKSGGGN